MIGSWQRSTRRGSRVNALLGEIQVAVVDREASAAAEAAAELRAVLAAWGYGSSPP